MIWNMENFKEKPRLYAQIQDGDIFLGGNLSSETLDDNIIADKKNLKFYKANLNNLVLHDSCRVEQCSQVRE